ncbi:alpha/beta hydrolase family protein [Robertkochia flava]|uniref:alpha/beta hydrolase family protein n=1 Tax=Robertkochia flava TaxID=3447986 RepID=UPI001CC94E40|nr:prolyl oligopeptidase family serine peptidase [Robertkochia marina]
MKNTYVFLLGLLLSGVGLYGQKRSLTPADFDQWKTIEGAKLAPNGRYLSYELQPGMGDNSLIIKDLQNGRTDTIPRGTKVRFSGDGSYIAFSIQPQIALRRTEETGEVDRKKRQEDSLGIYILETGRLIKFPSNHGYSMPEKGSSWLAYKTLVNTASEQGNSALALKDSLDSGDALKEVKKDTLLLALNPLKGDSLAFSGIKEYHWAKKADVLLMRSEVKDSAGVQSHLLTFKPEAMSADTVFSRMGEVKGISLDEAGAQLAFLYTSDTTKVKSYALFTGTATAINEVPADQIRNLPEGWAISKNANPFFSENGKKLFFGTAYPESETVRDTLLSRERAKLDIWAWTDKQLQPMQLLNKTKDGKRTFRAVYHTEQKTALQLADSTLPEIRVLNHRDARFAIGTDNEPYERARSWSGLWISDYYMVDTESGERTLLAEAQQEVEIGPDERYAIVFDRTDSIYYGIEIASGKREPLTRDLDVVFYDELHDTPSEPRPYGIAGWSRNDEYVFVYDRFDIWRLDPSGKKKPVNLTENGRATKTIYRYQEMDSDEDYIDLRKEVMLTVLNEENKKQGFALTRFNRAKAPELMLMGDHQPEFIAKAKDANRLVFTLESFTTFPDLMVSATDLKNPVKVSDAGRQMLDYKWGETRLVAWEGYDGTKLQGILYVPEGLDASARYPMVTYFYERSSDRIHNFVHPTPSRSTINKAFYVSNDYVVFVPDIVYRDGYPGQSAYDCIVSGVEAMVANNPFIDSDKVALQGQSWGGYQTAYLITQTNRFAAAMAGAPVSNMTSAYGGIRWGSGMSRMFQYERTQSRLGVTLWDDMDLYIKNSPLFYADKVETPLMMMHNDDDGAVPWYQGIEFFVALRRLDKPVWMLNYNGMPHNLSGSAWGNRKDLSIRMMQFFDHYLKGKDAPQWMERGRPAVEKGVNKAY